MYSGDMLFRTWKGWLGFSIFTLFWIAIVMYGWALNAYASTVLETPTKLLCSGRANDTFTSTGDKILASCAIPSTAGENYKILFSWKLDTATSVDEPRMAEGSTSVIANLYPGAIGTQNLIGECTLYFKQSNGQAVTRCDTMLQDGTTLTQASGVDILGGTLNYRTNITTTSSRTINWSWSVYQLRGSSATTTIQEENTTTISWANVTSTPTSLGGYGISDTKANFDTALNNGNFFYSGDTLAWSSLTSTPSSLSGYGITDAVPSSRTITIDGTAYDLTANRSWTTTGGGGGGCTDFACLTGTDGIIIYDEVSLYAFVLAFLLITFALTFLGTYKTIKMTL